MPTLKKYKEIINARFIDINLNPCLTTNLKIAREISMTLLHPFKLAIKPSCYN